jgi:hypothetical protein
MPKVFTVTKEGSGEVLAIIDLEKGEIVEKDGIKILTEEEVTGYVEEEVADKVTYKEFDISDIELIKRQMDIIGDVASKFIDIADDIIPNEDYYRKQGIKSIIDERQNCLAVGHALKSALCSLGNIYNIAGLLDCNAEKIKKEVNNG